MTQYRINPPKGLNTANIREEASKDSHIVVALERDQIVNVDPERTQDGDWLPVLFVRGWVHKSVVKAVE